MSNLPESQTLFVVGAYFTLLLGMVWMSVRSPMLAAWGIAGNDTLEYMARRYAALFFGYAVILGGARDEPPNRGRQAIVAGSFVSTALMACMSLYDVLSAAINGFGWMPIGLETLLAAGFGTLLYKNMAAAWD